MRVQYACIAIKVKLQLQTISLRLPDRILQEIDALVDAGVYASRTEALREGARLLLRAQTGSLSGKPIKVSKDEIWKEFEKEKS
jgi:Arc/MetJ-type ribon-helix-helix transcriptional regulator